MEAHTHASRRLSQRPVRFEGTLTFRLPADVAGALADKANRSGKTKSEWLRAVILREVGAAGHEVAS